LPLLMEERDGRRFLVGHLMKNLDHHNAFLKNPQVLAVFTSPNVYVSGSWYSNPYTPSTWNYMSVHAKGMMRFVDESELKRILRKTTLHFESDDEGSPTTFDQLPSSLTDRLVKMIAGFEIEISSLKGVFKLSQDRDEDSYQRIIEKLRTKNEAARFIAAEMEERKDSVFS
ncbi:MAG: FMN-binding negative transcriptional regulator, partial [Pseudomonadota bacterium]